jgi:L-alanine-DL-glutamate epimerase-like enolase superfamily enzyme
MNRSTFLQTIGLGGLASLLPIGSSAKDNLASGARGQVKITEVKSYLFKKACFVKIETDAGISGWGESDGANKKFTPIYIEKELKQYVIGRDPFDSEGIWHEAYLKGLEAGIGGIHPGSLAGIDNALWDLKGKLLNMPAHKLLGGNGKDKIRVYASFGRDKGNYNYMSPSEIAKIGADFVGQGYQAVKLRMQIRQENVNPFPDDTFECVAALRKAVGDDTILFVDFNNGYTPAKAVEMGLRLYEKLNINALEEPVFQQDYHGLGEVSRRLPIPVMAGEHEYNRWMIRDILEQGGVEIVNADVIKCGGISECKKVASLVHTYGKQVMVHNAKPTLATAASLQLLASITNGATFQEYAGKRLHQNYGPLYELFDNYFTFTNGFLHLPDEPGLGLVVNEKQMERKKLN